jgi:hypothetical protein
VSALDLVGMLAFARVNGFAADIVSDPWQAGHQCLAVRVPWVSADSAGVETVHVWNMAQLRRELGY